jgi:hypothetical protein
LPAVGAAFQDIIRTGDTEEVLFLFGLRALWATSRILVLARKGRGSLNHYTEEVLELCSFVPIVHLVMVFEIQERVPHASSPYCSLGLVDLDQVLHKQALERGVCHHLHWVLL